MFNGISAKAGLPEVFLLCQGKPYRLQLKRVVGCRPRSRQRTSPAAVGRIGTAFGLDAAIRQLASWELLKSRADVRGNG
jgi:hypothetical protein